MLYNRYMVLGNITSKLLAQEICIKHKIKIHSELNIK